MTMGARGACEGSAGPYGMISARSSPIGKGRRRKGRTVARNRGFPVAPVSGVVYLPGMARHFPVARPAADVAALARGIRAGERAMLARAITLVESRRADHQKAAGALVQSIIADTGRAVRVGITG